MSGVDRGVAMKSNVAAVAVGIGLSLSAVAGAAQDCLEQIGSSPYGWSEDVAVEGDLAVLGNGRAVQTIDLTDPANPVVVGEIALPLLVLGVAIEGDRVYAGTSRMLEIVDISDPTQPELLGSLDGFYVRHLEIESDRLYVLDNQSLAVVDVSSPMSPAVVGVLDWPGVFPRDLSVSGGTGFVVVDGSMKVVDLSDPAAPTEVTELSFGVNREATRLDVEGDKLYVAVRGTDPSTSNLVVVDVSVPSQPTAIAEVGAPFGVADIDAHGNLVVMSSSYGVEVFDVSAPASPLWTGSEPIECLYSLAAVAAMDGLALVTCEVTGLSILDTADPGSPTVVASVSAPGSVEDATVDGETLLIAGDSNGLRVVDVGDPAQPVELGSTIVLPQTFGVATLGDIAYAIGYHLVAIDVTDPGLPVVLGSEPDVTGNWITIEGDRGYVVSTWGGTASIVDLSSPSLPIALGTATLASGWWEWPVVIGDHLIVRGTLNDTFVVVIDASDPMTPAQVASFDVWSFGGLATTGSWLLVPDIIDGLEPAIRVFDMRDPAVPVEVAPYHPVGGAVEAIGVAGSVAYLAVLDNPPHQVGAIEVVNFADPMNPIFMDLIERPGRVKRFAFGPGELYAFGRATGFDIFALCRGPIFADGFESGDTTAWSSAAP